jgi:hypothetical protein
MNGLHLILTRFDSGERQFFFFNDRFTGSLLALFLRRREIPVLDMPLPPKNKLKKSLDS